MSLVNRFHFERWSLALAIGLALSGAPVAYAEPQEASTQELDEVVVTGFRGSLNNALGQKREETASIDVIASEDVGKFPDSNLAESMQRIPSVALSRGDGGEGKNISVRGLGPTFTRVRINGMEGSSQTGSSDIYGAGNNGRGFDFNVFPTEIFSQLAVRKTMSADVEEGSLGATVDLRAPRPLDLPKDTVFTLTARGIYNDVSENVDPRYSALFSKKFADGAFGMLASAAYQERHSREVGYSAVDVLAASTNANNIAVTPMGGPVPPGIYLPYCTPVGWTTTAPSPVLGARGSTAANCSQSLYGGVNPRTSDLAAFTAVYNMTNPGILDPVSHVPIPGGGAFFPRLPRYVNSEQDTERTGGTLSFQWAPGDATKVSLDTLYSRYQVERRDNYIAGISTGRNLTNNGQPMVSIRNVSFDPKGSVQTVTFDGMDVRSEGLVDDYIATFKQINLDLEHQFTDSFKMTMSAGRSVSVWDGPKRLQTFIDAIDTDNFTLDFTGRETPQIGFGFDVSNPNNFIYAPTNDGNQTVVGGYSFQGKPSRNVTANTLFELGGDWQMNDTFKFKGGLQWRNNNYKSRVSGILAAQTTTRALPAGTTLADYTRTIDDLDDLFGSGAPASWVAMDPDKWAAAFNYPEAFNFCGIECGANRSGIVEEVSSAFAMMSWKAEWGIPVRGDLGVRYAHTRQSAFGYIPIANPGGAFPNIGFRQDVDKTYHDWLPSLNVVAEFTPNLLLRFSAAKVMARADLGSLSPSVSVTATTQNAVVNNPLLDPIRAKTADLALEWYFSEGSLLSAALFYKDIETYIQRVTGDEPFRNLGVPDSVLAGSPSSPTDLFHVARLQNTDGGPLKGFELNAQVQLKMLPGFLADTGFLANYTHVESTIQYVLTSAAGVPLTFTKDDLVDLSPNTASVTLFYDNGTVSVRTTAAYRDAYIRALPASAGSDIRGNKANTFVDASASWNVNDHFTLILEGQNLTDERNTLFIDRSREDTLFQTEIGRTVNLGATFKF